MATLCFLLDKKLSIITFEFLQIRFRSGFGSRVSMLQYVPWYYNVVKKVAQNPAVLASYYR